MRPFQHCIKCIDVRHLASNRAIQLTKLFIQIMHRRMTICEKDMIVKTYARRLLCKNYVRVQELIQADGKKNQSSRRNYRRLISINVKKDLDFWIYSRRLLYENYAHCTRIIK